MKRLLIWIWWMCVLRKDEFHPRLDAFSIRDRKQLRIKRNVAHILDLMDYNHPFLNAFMIDETHIKNIKFTIEDFIPYRILLKYQFYKLKKEMKNEYKI